MSNDDIFIVRDLQHFASITDSIKSQNLHYQNVILEQGIMEANYHISRQLELGLGTKLFYMKRLRIVEGHPRSIETNYINYQLVEGLETMDFSNVSFYDVVLQKKDIVLYEVKKKSWLLKPKMMNVNYCKCQKDPRFY